MFYSYFTAYSFKCYECENDDNGVIYDTPQCEQDQKKVDCGANHTCVRIHYTRKRDDVVKEVRGCAEKSWCEEFRKICKEGTIEQKEKMGIKKCEEVVCCVSDGDTPCNSGFIVPTTNIKKCYQCENDDIGVNYNTSQCEKDQGKVDCTKANSTCFRYHYTTTRDDEKEGRGCVEKKWCEEFRKLCKEGTIEEKKKEGIKKCEEAVCCESDGDTPCNSGFIVPTANIKKCYQCENDDIGVNYNTSQCEKDQGKVDCTKANSTCFRYHYTTTRDDEKEGRGCVEKKWCEDFRKLCKEGTIEEKKKEGIKKCEEAVCCESDGDTPCNSGFIAPTSSGFTVSIDMMMMIMLAVLCSLKIF